jgi:hypothetical protein
MIETINLFFTNVWGWVLEHKEEISTFFMSGQFVSLVTAIVMLIKNAKQIRSNTSSTETLNSTLTNTNTMSGQITSLEKSFTKLEKENAGLRDELEKTKNAITTDNKLIANKLNAILEVQSIVYSTIRDESVRQTVNTLLNNARYSDKNFKEQLQTEIEAIKTEFESKMSDMSKAVNQTINNVSKSMNAVEDARNKQTKSAEDETTRY